MKKIIMITAILAFLLGIGVSAAYYFYKTDVSSENGGGQSTEQKTLVEEYQPPEEIPELEAQYDVVVIGGEPEGVAAAVSAARNGSSVLLVERRDGLGGLMTFGMLNFIDMVQGIGGDSAVAGIFKEWHELVGGGSSYDIELAKAAFLKLVTDEENITLALETDFTSAIVENGTVTGVELENENGVSTVSGERFIDATQDADFAAAAGAPFYIGGEDINLKDRLMSVTPMIHLTGLDWDGVKQAAEDEVFGYGAVTPIVAWGFGDLHTTYPAVEENTRLRGLNLVRVPGDEDQYYINALQIFGVDGLDEESKAEGLERGIRETEHIVKWLRENFPGFENAEIASFPDEMYVRETRHMQAEYILQMSDIWTHADHWDSIGFGGYPVDVQATSVNDYGYVLSSPVQYAVPFRSLVPLEIDNILVVSRSAGYSSLAAGSARIIPTGMAAAEAGGAAAAQTIEADITFRELSQSEEGIEQLRTTLADQGALVEHFDIDYPYEGEWFDGAVQYLMDYGLAFGGYDNDLQVAEPQGALGFLKTLGTGLIHTDDRLNEQYGTQLADITASVTSAEELLTREAAGTYLVEAFSEEAVSANPWDQAFELGLIDETIHSGVDSERELTRAEGYYLLYSVLVNLNGQLD
ncbi:FAD-dependent oxidoreductase [Planococcus salinarum]|uniref:FAD-dependent oxidoreductase n=1 Tax=Planococcus salinarum TaxID=622695 RepID=UPI000E3CCC55|nr:FAD-dependent oxidoreductase [Planococcus salinarum]TAA72876.1 FAD-dependent oxidoreductase [Planococcus salinarum]